MISEKVCSSSSNRSSSEDEVIPVKAKINLSLNKNISVEQDFNTAANLENESPTLKIQKKEDFSSVFRNQLETIIAKEKLAEETTTAAEKDLKDKIAREIRRKMFLTKEELEMNPEFLENKYDDFKQV